MSVKTLAFYHHDCPLYHVCKTFSSSEACMEHLQANSAFGKCVSVNEYQATFETKCSFLGHIFSSVWPWNRLGNLCETWQTGDLKIGPEKYVSVINNPLPEILRMGCAILSVTMAAYSAYKLFQLTLLNSENKSPITKDGKAIDDKQATNENKNSIIIERAKRGLKELAKAVGNAAMLAIVALGATCVGFVAFKLTSMLVAIIAFPTAIIPPLYSALTTLGGLAAGGAVGYLFTKKYGQTFFNQMKDHFNHSMHLFRACNNVRNFQKVS